MMIWRNWYKRLGEHKRAVVAEFKANGFKGVVRAYGWKLLLAVFLFYLIRDTILYIIIPLLAGRAIWQSLTG
jgi:hypothetical protein